MTDPTVSVIIPTYNRQHLLPRAMGSVLSQTFQNWELVVVDDGSTDGTPQVIQRYLNDARIHYLRKGNAGLGAARNSGMRMAKGRYFAFLDDDDLFLPRKFERQVAWMDRHPEVGLLYGPVQMVDGEMRHLKTTPQGPGQSFVELFLKCFIQVPTVLIRCECFEQVGHFDERLGGSEDYLMWLQIAERFPIAYLPEVLSIYCQHGKNRSLNLLAQRMNGVKILSRFKVNPTLGLTRALRNRRLSVAHYRLAREYRNRHHYFSAARHFFHAFWLNPTVGTIVKDRPVKSAAEWFIQLCKPYGGALYCFVRGMFHSKEAALWQPR